MLKPIEFLIAHKSAVLQAYNNSKAKPKNAWDSLRKQLPKMSETMTFSTFKQYLSVFVALNAKLETQHDHELTKLRHETVKYSKDFSLLKQTLMEKNSEIKQEKSFLSKISQRIQEISLDFTAMQLKMKTLEAELSDSKPKVRNIEGWTIRLTPKGYYHLCKSFGGKVKTIYIGKVLDEKKARQKIAEYMTKLR